MKIKASADDCEPEGRLKDVPLTGHEFHILDSVGGYRSVGRDNQFSKTT